MASKTKRGAAALVPPAAPLLPGVEFAALPDAAGLLNEAANAAADWQPSWAEAVHEPFTVHHLTEDDPRAPTPDGFSHPLYPPQQATLAAMQRLERHPYLRVAPNRHQPDAGMFARVSMARIAELPSFGKTVVALALCTGPVPALLPPLASAVGSMHPVNATQTRTRMTIPECALHYSRYLPMSIVVAAASVISQWELNAKKFTPNLRTFTVDNVHTLRAFERLYRGHGNLQPNLLFIKAGRVSTSFVVEGETAANTGATLASKDRSLIVAIGRVLEGVPVARLVFDDYDTLRLGCDDRFIPALFTWLISATRRTTSMRNVGAIRAKTPAEYFRNILGSVPVLNVAHDEMLNGMCSLQCAPEFVNFHISSTVVKFRRIVVPGGRVAGMLNNLLHDDAARGAVIEMVNADAIGDAARALNIDAASVGDLVRRVVGAHLDKLRLAARTARRIAEVRRAAEPEDDAEEAEAEPREADAEEAKAEASFAIYDPCTSAGLRRALREGTDAEFASVWGWDGPDALHLEAREAILSDAEAAIAVARDTYGKTLNRMRDNVREGCCQICTIPHVDQPGLPAYVLAGCCQVIICEYCVTVRAGIASANRKFIERCPNCAKVICAKTGLIRVGVELDIEAALGGDMLAIVQSAEPEMPAAPAAARDPERPANPTFANPKLRALVQFIKNQQIECVSDAETPPTIRGLLQGTRDIPWPAERPRKILLFTMHTDMVARKHIEFALEMTGVPFSTLHGSRTQRDAAVAALREATTDRVMLVMAANDCAGLDMPWLSHVVFYHRVIDPNVESQVAARGQRCGRASNLTILTLMNELEARN